jgi:predicted lipid-binding transport protein (Tim44 family)
VTSIIIFAMVAAFLGMRLYAVLGKRTGHEQPLAGVPDEAPRSLTTPGLEPARDPLVIAQEEALSAEVEAGLRTIGASDRNFSAPDFVGGAKAAYKMILEAFWAGKEEEFAPYVSDDVREAFSDAIKARSDEGHVLDNRMIAIERAVIASARLERGIAEIMITFDADIAAITRDSSGAVIAGSLTDAVPTHDSWTFTRDVKSSNPNWILTDTDEAS